MDKAYTITELAKFYEVTSRTIRHYEELGLLCPERKGNQRIFYTRDKVRLGLILRGRRIGFSLNEIREIINMYDQPEGEIQQTSFILKKVEDRRKMLLGRKDDINNMLSELDDIEAKLKHENTIENEENNV
ncbi:MAG: MerR family transcriptional regulator [Gammaproteobacteria bacterium]|nr:MAG: MerR family transcriptional regulator [Gammaproteobacteria bacterium]